MRAEYFHITDPSIMQDTSHEPRVLTISQNWAARPVHWYYDEKIFFSFSLDSDFYLAKMHHANYCGSISKPSLIYLTTISHLNCPPLPDSVPVDLHFCIERAGSRGKVASFTYEFNFSMCVTCDQVFFFRRNAKV